MRTVVAALLTTVSLAGANAQAAVLYKLTDRLGNVTYSDSVPRGFDGAVARLEIDPSASSVPSEQIPSLLVPAPAQPSSTRIAVARANVDDERLRAARGRVDAARQALASARDNSTAEDWIYYARNPVTGARRMPSPEYAQRLERLEQDVVVAEGDLSTLEREIRLR
jgi:hypothetical protein